MKIKIYLFILGISLLISACTQKENTCIITGKVINRPQSTELRLTKSFVDFRSQSAIQIPIKDSSFYYELHFKDIEAYTLVFDDEFIQGAMRPITFFATDGTINMELYPMNEYKKNIISGGKENSDFIEYQKNKMDEMGELTKPIQDSMRILQANDNYNSQEMKDLLERLKNTEKQEDKFKMYTEINEMYQSGEGLSIAARKLNAQYDSISKLFQDREVEYLRNNVTIPSYYMLIQAIIYTKDFPKIFELEPLRNLQKVFSSKFKNHSYTEYSNEILWRIANLKPGGEFFDFTLPDTIGTEHTLSKEISGKFAFIDIWAPWCGPCIAKSREMKPIYDTYKDKGFTVVGVASKYEEFENVLNLLKKDKYPWITLVDKPELDSRINEHYGIEMAGGGCVLVDNSGKIVLVNPTVEDVQKVLETNLTVN